MSLVKVLMCRRHVTKKFYFDSEDDENLEDDIDDNEMKIKTICTCSRDKSTSGRAPIRERALSTFIIQRLTNTLGWLMH